MAEFKTIDGNWVVYYKIQADGKEYSYELSTNQVRFIKDALEAGLEVEYSYSGRGMFGTRCPSVRVDNVHSLETNADVCTDQMGRGYVIYARF